MATKKQNTEVPAQAEQQQIQNQTVQDSDTEKKEESVQAESQEQQSTEQQGTEEKTADQVLDNQPQPETSKQPETGEKSSEQPQKKLIAFHELTAKHRLPTWQSTAVLKLLDKEDDVFLSEQEFLTALKKLHSRSMGV